MALSITDLPNELLLIILELLSDTDKRIMFLTCRKFYLLYEYTRFGEPIYIRKTFKTLYYKCITQIVLLNYTKSLGDSLNNMINLEGLNLGKYYNTPLNDSLSNLKTLIIV
jgi:hypothetical protein